MCFYIIRQRRASDQESPVLQQCHKPEFGESAGAHVVVYYVIALALYLRSSYREVLRCLLEGVQWLLNPSAKVKVAGKSGISQARCRLGAEPLKRLYDAVVGPIAEKRTKGSWYRQWRLVGLDGSRLDVADTAENDKAFGRPGSSRGYISLGQVFPHRNHPWAMHSIPLRSEGITFSASVSSSVAY